MTASPSAPRPALLRVATVNLFAHHGDWPAPREALRAGLHDLDADLLAVQPSDHYAVVANLLPPVARRSDVGVPP